MGRCVINDCKLNLLLLDLSEVMCMRPKKVFVTWFWLRFADTLLKQLPRRFCYRSIRRQVKERATQSQCAGNARNRGDFFVTPRINCNLRASQKWAQVATCACFCEKQAQFATDKEHESWDFITGEIVGACRRWIIICWSLFDKCTCWWFPEMSRN